MKHRPSKLDADQFSIGKEAEREFLRTMNRMTYRLERMWDALDAAYEGQPFSQDGLPPEHPKSARRARLYLAELNRITRLLFEQLELSRVFTSRRQGYAKPNLVGGFAKSNLLTAAEDGTQALLSHDREFEDMLIAKGFAKSRSQIREYAALLDPRAVPDPDRPPMMTAEGIILVPTKLPEEHPPRGHANNERNMEGSTREGKK